MNIEKLRADLRQWISSKVRIDKWDLDAPSSLYSDSSTTELVRTANTAIEYPVENLSYQKDGLNSLQGMGIFSYSIIFRYEGLLKEDQLPLSKLESLVEYLQGKALLTPPSASVIALSLEDVPTPISITREAADQGDWLIQCNISFNITFRLSSFNLDPDFAPPGDSPTLPTITRLKAKIYRGKVGFNINNPETYTQDSEIELSGLPIGFYYLLGADGKRLLGIDGRYLLGENED